MKGISKVLSLIGKIAGIVARVAIGFIVVVMIGLPFMFKYIDVKDGKLVSTNDKIQIVKYDNGYDVTIQDDMHNFVIECNEDIEELYRTLILTMYKYATGRTSTSATSLYYKPGVKYTNSVQNIKVRW